MENFTTTVRAHSGYISTMRDNFKTEYENVIKNLYELKFFDIESGNRANTKSKIKSELNKIANQIKRPDIVEVADIDTQFSILVETKMENEKVTDMKIHFITGVDLIKNDKSTISFIKNKVKKTDKNILKYKSIMSLYLDTMFEVKNI